MLGFLQYILDDDGSIEHILESRGGSFINVRIVAKLPHYILAFAGSVMEAEVGLFLALDFALKVLRNSSLSSSIERWWMGLRKLLIDFLRAVTVLYILSLLFMFFTLSG